TADASPYSASTRLLPVDAPVGKMATARSSQLTSVASSGSPSTSAAPSTSSSSSTGLSSSSASVSSGDDSSTTGDPRLLPRSQKRRTGMCVERSRRRVASSRAGAPEEAQD